MTNADVKQLNTKFDNFTSRFAELIEFLSKRFDIIDSKFDTMDSRLENVEIQLDNVFGEIVSMRQENSILSHRTLTMERWIINGAKKLKLPYKP